MASSTRWWTLGAVSVATFMLLLDITVVNVALPSMREDLDASFSDLQWVIDAYVLTLAAFVLTAGQVFLAGLNDVLTLGGVMSLVGAALALWLIRPSDVRHELDDVDAELDLAA
jgi:MFS family permease